MLKVLFAPKLTVVPGVVGVTVPLEPEELVTSKVLIAKEAVTEMFLVTPKSVLGFMTEPSLHETNW